jgi:hypothetical protein
LLSRSCSTAALASATPPSVPAGEATASEDEAPLTPHATREGDDGRRTSSAPPPPVRVLGKSEPGRPDSADPKAPSLDARIQRRWRELVAAALDAGQDARHCQREKCFHNDREAIEVCECDCDGCARAGELYIAAKREITGRE